MNKLIFRMGAVPRADARPLIPTLSPKGRGGFVLPDLT